MINPDVESEILYHQGGNSDGCMAWIPVGERMIAYHIAQARGPAYSEVYERQGEIMVFIGTSTWPPKFDQIEPIAA